MIDHAAEFALAKELGQHAYEAEVRGIGKYKGGVSTMYVYALTPEEAKANMEAKVNPSQEKVDEVRLQTPKSWDLKPGCQCVVCQSR